MNRDFFRKYITESEDSPCEEPVSLQGPIDFRVLLLPAEEALSMGGTGTQPYGDIIPSIMSLLKNQFLVEGEDGELLELNSLLIEPMTLDQSGSPGMLHFPSELFSIV